MTKQHHTMSKKTAQKDTPNLAKDGPDKARPTSHREKVMFDQLDRIEAAISKVHEELLSVRSIAHHARTAARVNTGKLDLLLSGATFMQELDKAAPQPVGLSPGDYTDASKETADALTAMGWGWFEGDHRVRKQIMLAYNMKMAHVGGISGDGSNTYLTPSEFLSRASVTAKEIGLVPVVEKWVPKAGDWITAGTGTLYKMLGVNGPDNWSLEYNGTAYGYNTNVKQYRPATDAEVQQHLAEQEARKPVEFGTRVEYEDDRGWHVACNEADKHGWWMIVKPSTRSVCSAKRHELTVIEQP